MQQMCSAMKRGVDGDAAVTFIDPAMLHKHSSRFLIWLP